MNILFIFVGIVSLVLHNTANCDEELSIEGEFKAVTPSKDEKKPEKVASDDKGRAQDFYQRCVNQIYRKCQHRTNFTDKELDDARLYIQGRFQNITNPLWAPVKPACPKIYVRKDWKCMSAKERQDMINAFQELYKNGVNTQLALWPHGAYWGPWHKFIDGAVTHRWQMNEFEKELMKVNPSLRLPYWNPFEDYDRQELSIVWDYLGHAGDSDSNYCVKDGPFVNVKPCVKRQWVNDTTIQPINPNEYYDGHLQNMGPITDFFQWDFPSHFKPHLAIGGLHGHMSAPNAPYDNAFQLYHVWNDAWVFKWQLQNDTHLMPISYDGNGIYDPEIDGPKPGSLATDKFIYFDTLVKEAFQIGFGDQCAVPDIIIDDIQYVVNNRQKPMPKKYQTMPAPLLQKWFPKFASGNFTPFDWISHDVPNCNRQCLPIQQSQLYNATQEGEYFLERIKYWGHLNIVEPLLLLDAAFQPSFTADLNSGGYCSPYIIS